MIRTQVGYSGGTAKNPTYTNLGDHSESLRIEFDPERVSYEALLEIFWENHSPGVRSLSRQYAPVLFYHDEAQRQAALASRARVAARIRGPVHTEIVPAGRFYPAEDYHQKYGLRSERELMSELRAFYPEEDRFAASTAAARINGYVSGEGSRAELEAEIASLGLSATGQRRLLEIVATP